MKADNILVGLCDADLIDGGTTLPNLALLKIAGFLHDNSIPFELIESGSIDTFRYTYIYISKVFTFTRIPAFMKWGFENDNRSKMRWGGTGFYGEDDPTDVFIKLRNEDMTALENDDFLSSLPNHSSQTKEYGIDMCSQMPYYDLYKEFVQKKLDKGEKRSKYSNYLDCSIGFLTRGCFRKCPFCVNRLETKVHRYSQLDSFLDNTRDNNGKLVRPVIYLLDDNFLATPPHVWRKCFDELEATKRPFVFKQGLDERIIADSPYGEEIAQRLSKAKYHGNYIFAFDNWSDRDRIEKALKIWKRYVNKKTQFYLFCGYQMDPDDDEKLYRDVWELFQRIRVLMQYDCIGYVMRHASYVNHRLSNIFSQVANWCNSKPLFLALSFWEFCYKRQSYLEKHYHKLDVPDMISFDEFEARYRSGYYDNRPLYKSLKTFIEFIDAFPHHREEILAMFNYKLKNLIDPTLWKINEHKKN